MNANSDIATARKIGPKLPSASPMDACNLQSTFAAFSFYDAGVTPKLIGLILAILFGVIVIGGAKRLVRVTAVMVPVMGVIYVLVSLLIMALNITNIPHMLQ